MIEYPVCECGHVPRMHTDDKCRACPCNKFTRATDAHAAILAGAERKRAQVAAANHRRSAKYRQVTR